MLEILNKYYDEGLVYKQIHPKLPLSIWNYSEKVQYQNLWDEITLQARGLVTDNKGNVLARPFRKFFNMEEGKHNPTVDFDVYDKLDGSLGILFNYDGEWVFATRGSFTSDQSIKGFELLQKYNFNKLHKSYTYLFEIIYDDNRIVVDYNFEDVVLLGMVHTESGEEYLRLHKIMTNVSTTSVWEMLSTGQDVTEILKDVPDEFFDRIKSYVKELSYKKMTITEHAGKLFDSYYESYDGDLPEKSKYAQWVLKMDRHLQPILFKMYDRKDYQDYVWRLIKPEYKKL